MNAIVVKPATEVRLGERVVADNGAWPVAKLFCDVRDKLVEMELREDQILKRIIRTSPNTLVKVIA